MSPRGRGLCGAIAVALILAGCARQDALDRNVAADTATAFATWRAYIDSDSSIEIRRQVTEAIQEIRLKVSGDREIKRAMGEAAAPGEPGIDDALREKVRGRPLREMLQLGYELRRARLKAELAGLEQAMAQNAQLVTKPGDLESKHHLEGLRDRQMARVEKYRADIDATEQTLAPLLKASGKLLVPPGGGAAEADTAPRVPSQKSG